MQTTQIHSNINLTVLRDGNLETSYIRAAQRAQVVQTIKDTIRRAITAPGRLIKAQASEAAKLIYLDLFDASNHTHLRAEYLRRKHQLAEQNARQLVGM